MSDGRLSLPLRLAAVLLVLAATVATMFISLHGRVYSIDFVMLAFRLLVCAGIALLVYRASPNELWAALSALLFPAVRLMIGPASGDMSGVGIPLLCLGILLALERVTPLGAALAGALAGGLFLTGIPVGGVLVAAVAITLFSEFDRPEDRLKRLGFLLAGFLVAAPIVPLIVYLTQSDYSLSTVLRHASHQFGVGDGLSQQLIREIIEETVRFLGERFSITLSVLAGAGIVAATLQSSPLNGQARRLVRNCMIVVAALLFTGFFVTGVEYGSFDPILPFLAIPTALGGIILYRLFAVSIPERGYRMFVIVGCLLAALLLSPLPRYLIGHGNPPRGDVSSTRPGPKECSIPDVATVTGEVTAW